jgi:hypothetical protein
MYVEIPESFTYTINCSLCHCAGEHFLLMKLIIIIKVNGRKVYYLRAQRGKVRKVL